MNTDESNPVETIHRSLLRTVQRGFLIWSWLGLLGAYVTTSGFYSNQAYFVVTRGLESIELARYSYVATYTLLIPVVVLIVGWISFLQYSTAILRVAILPEDEGEHKAPWRLAFLFRNSLMFLILAWVAILFVVLFPFLLSRS